MFFVCELFDISLSSVTIFIVFIVSSMDCIIIHVKVYVEESESSLFFRMDKRERESSSSSSAGASRWESTLWHKCFLKREHKAYDFH